MAVFPGLGEGSQGSRAVKTAVPWHAPSHEGACANPRFCPSHRAPCSTVRTGGCRRLAADAARDGARSRCRRRTLCVRVREARPRAARRRLRGGWPAGHRARDGDRRCHWPAALAPTRAAPVALLVLRDGDVDRNRIFAPELVVVSAASDPMELVEAARRPHGTVQRCRAFERTCGAREAGPRAWSDAPDCRARRVRARKDRVSTPSDGPVRGSASPRRHAPTAGADVAHRRRGDSAPDGPRRRRPSGASTLRAG